MTLDLGATGLYAAIAIAWVAPLALLVATSRQSPCPPLWAALLLIALAATTVAFLSGHFLLRYVALEIVALAVALSPLVEKQGGEGARLARLVYLLLRVGDAGLLVSIAILRAGSGTLDIGPALQAGQALAPGLLGWTAIGLVLAVWVKVGGWPFSLWLRVGGRLPRSRAWLFATAMPSLGLYLLYRVTPLLARAEMVRGVVFWIGAGGAVVAVLVALAQTDLGAGIVFACSAQAGLALLLAATGAKTAVWLTVLVLMPLRLLLHLAADLPGRRKVRAGMFALGGGCLTAWSALCTFWARAADAPWPMLVWGEAAVGLLAVWTLSAAWRCWGGHGESRERVLARGNGPGWGAAGILATGILLAVVAFGPLLHGLVHVAHSDLPAEPTLPALLRYLATASAMWGVGLLAVVAWILRWPLPWLMPVPIPRSRASSSDEGEGRGEGTPPSVSLDSTGRDEGGHTTQLPDLETTLIRTAQTLRSTVEEGALDRAISEVDRVVLGTAYQTHRAVEQRILEDAVHHLALGTARGARSVHRIVEQGGLEGLLRAVVRATFSLARTVQGWHAGKLRRNLLWIAICLALATWAVFVGW
jgi:hypothetical protein